MLINCYNFFGNKILILSQLKVIHILRSQLFTFFLAEKYKSSEVAVSFLQYQYGNLSSMRKYSRIGKLLLFNRLFYGFF